MLKILYIKTSMNQNLEQKDLETNEKSPIDFTDSFLPPVEKELQKVEKKKHRWFGARFHLTIHGQKPQDLERLIAWFEAGNVKRPTHLVKHGEKMLNAKGEYVDVQPAYRTQYVKPFPFAIKLAVIAKEFGKHKIHPHWQVYFELANRESMKMLMMDLLGHENFHLEKAKSTSAASIAYVYGVGKEHEGGFVVYNLNAPVPERYNSAVSKFWLNFVPRPFQKTLLNLIDRDACKRRIFYIHEPHGNVGKTLLIEYLHIFHGAIVTGGSSADMKYAIERWRQITGAFPIFICIDVARSAELTKESYEAIESIKNGLFFSGKYESTMTHSFQKPHVLIFSNKPPKIEAFSNDRWAVFTIDKNYELIDDNGDVVSTI